MTIQKEALAGLQTTSVVEGENHLRRGLGEGGRQNSPELE